ncbi:MAG TPA: hypothetical protein VJZ00_16380 [Thermoanaerobaculia bacterium]|nr:hypothetical protein [Thermoanaerobaculia bacterium]
MKRLLVTVALAFVAVPAFAAIQYDFIQKHTTDDAVTPTRDLSGRATIDGARSRVDFLSGNVYPPGTYVISTDGSRRLFFVDPTNKWYTEINTSGFATALGAAEIKITNQKSEMEPRTDTAKIAGYEAKHQRLTLSFDVTVTMKGIPLRQHARVEIDAWTTDQFPEQQSALDAMRTGNPEIDAVLEAESTKIHGFPLRRTVAIHLTSEVAVKSQLQLPRSKTITRETLVTSIREANPDAMLFVVPVSYKRAEQPDAPRTETKTITFDPEPGSE